jgi:hypothetical protein
MPRVTRFRRCSSGRKGGSNDSQTSASMSVSALPETPEGKVPRPVTCRSPSRPLPAIAVTDSGFATGSPAEAATQICSTTPVRAPDSGRCGLASAISAAARRKPSSITYSDPPTSSAGSQTMPDGTPYMTTLRRRFEPERRRAIHGPGHENEAGSARGAKPIPKPPSQRVTVKPVAGSSSGAGRGSASKRSSRIVATQARNEATSSGGPSFGMLTSLIAGSYWRAIRRLLMGRTSHRGSLRLGPKARRTWGPPGITEIRPAAAARRASRATRSGATKVNFGSFSAK